MILKIATTDGWQYISDIKDIHVAKRKISEYNKDTAGLGKKFHDIFFNSHGFSVLDNTIFCDGNSEISPHDLNEIIVELMYTLKNKEKLFSIADCAVYLLSDEGKTIERIN